MKIPFLESISGWRAQGVQGRGAADMQIVKKFTQTEFLRQNHTPKTHEFQHTPNLFKRKSVSMNTGLFVDTIATKEDNIVKWQRYNIAIFILKTFPILTLTLNLTPHTLLINPAV